MWGSLKRLKSPQRSGAGRAAPTMVPSDRCLNLFRQAIYRRQLRPAAAPRRPLGPANRTRGPAGLTLCTSNYHDRVSHKLSPCTVLYPLAAPACAVSTRSPSPTPAGAVFRTRPPSPSTPVPCVRFGWGHCWVLTQLRSFHSRCCVMHTAGRSGGDWFRRCRDAPWSVVGRAGMQEGLGWSMALAHSPGPLSII